MSTKHIISIISLLVLICLPAFLCAQENSAILCGDGIDNDGDGLIDCEDSDCQNLSNLGCAYCIDGLSFADTTYSLNQGCPIDEDGPDGALGVADWTDTGGDAPSIIVLGDGGVLKLGFINNVLTNSGDASEDLWVFEIGFVESFSIAVRPYDDYTKDQLELLNIPDVNLDGYYEIGGILAGATLGFDIDNELPGYDAGTLIFDAIELTDTGNGGCGGTSGADIDAVCALSNIPVDCLGKLNGTAIKDSCGICLELNDPMRNKSCLDCNGTVNGTAILDLCGNCLEPNDPDFNATCIDDYIVYIPNVFSPNNDGVNDKFCIFWDPVIVTKISEFTIYARWGDQVYHQSNIESMDFSYWWDGRVGDKVFNSGVFVYTVEVEFIDGEVRLFFGDVTVFR